MFTNPVVVIEVLSPTTEKRDRSTKFKAYKSLASVQEYVLISSEHQAIRLTGARATSGASTTINQATRSNSQVSASVFPLMRSIAVSPCSRSPTT